MEAQELALQWGSQGILLGSEGSVTLPKVIDLR
jgi:hypothetical protein